MKPHAQDDYTLPVGEVHVWHARVSSLAEGEQNSARLLSSSERERADEFRKTEDRSRYVCARGMLRKLLGRYLGKVPEGIEFRHGPHGKPMLAATGESGGIQFNLTHAADLVAIAISRRARVGIDLEFIREHRDLLEIAESQFSREECDGLKALSPAEQIGAFYRCWTRKEAWLKARGEGIVGEMTRFAVSFSRVEKPRILWSEADPQAGQCWELFNLDLVDGCAGALVVERGSLSEKPEILIRMYRQC